MTSSAKVCRVRGLPSTLSSIALSLATKAVVPPARKATTSACGSSRRRCVGPLGARAGAPGPARRLRTAARPGRVCSLGHRAGRRLRLRQLVGGPVGVLVRQRRVAARSRRRLSAGSCSRRAAGARLEALLCRAPRTSRTANCSRRHAPGAEVPVGSGSGPQNLAEWPSLSKATRLPGVVNRCAGVGVSSRTRGPCWRRGRRQRVLVDAADRGHRPHRDRNEVRRVGPSAVRRRGQEGRVGLDEDAVPAGPRRARRAGAGRS